MKTITLTLVSLFFLNISQAQWWEKGEKIKGNGNITTVTRTTSDYDGISCAGNFDYVLVAGTEGKITIEGEENLLKYIITEVKGDKLVVKTENNVNLKPSANKSILITIPFKDINNIALAGSGDLTSKDTVTASDLKVSIILFLLLSVNVSPLVIITRGLIPVIFFSLISLDKSNNIEG